MVRYHYTIDEAVDLITAEINVSVLEDTESDDGDVEVADYILPPLAKTNSFLTVLFSIELRVKKSLTMNLLYVTSCCCWTKA